MSHQLKPLQQWIFKLKWVVLATSMTVGLAVSESVWAGCSEQPAGFYCDINHTSYGVNEVACLAACVSAPSVPTYTLTLNTSGTGTGTVSGGGSYAEGTAVNLTAIGDSGSVFVGWSEELCDNTLILKENTTCTAKFEKIEPPNPNSPTASILPEYVSLAVQVAGSGSGTVSTDMGLSCKREDCEPNPKFPGELICQKNCEQSIKATRDVTLTQKADANSVFSGWGGHDDCVDGEVFMNGSKLCIAYFSRIYFLKVSTEGDGTVSGYGFFNQKPLINCGSICQVPWGKKMTVVLEARPAAGMIFDGWTGDCSGQKQQLIVPFNNDMNCQANFIDPNALKKPIDQTITNFSPATSAVVGDQMTVTATGGDSGNPVTFASITPEICTVSAETVHIITVGTCTLAADQAGNEDYNAAPQVTKSIIVTEPNKLDQVITEFSPATAAIVNSSLVLTAVGGKSGNPVKFASATQDICTVEASDRVNFKTVGTCTLTADQAGNEQFNAASTVTVTVQVNSPVKQGQVITDFLPTVYASVTDQAKINGQATLAATGGPSGNPVIYTSKTPEKCTVSGNVVTFLAEGTCEVIANQAGNDEYHPASQEIIKIEVASDQTTPPIEPAKFAGCTSPTIEEPLSVFNVSVCAKAPGQSEPLTYVREFKTLEDMQEFIKGITDTEEFKQIKQAVNNTSTDPTSGVNSLINVIDNTFDVSFNSKDNAGAIHAQVDGEKFNITFPNPKNGFKLEYSDSKGNIGTFQGLNAEDSIALLTEHLTQTAKQPEWVKDLIGSLLRGISSLVTEPNQTPTDSTGGADTPPVTNNDPSQPSSDCKIEETEKLVIISGSCDVKGQVFDKPVRILPGTSLSNATFNNTVDNQGFLSNSTIGEQGDVKGGKLSGFIENRGKVCDVEFVGSSFVGGTVCGKIQNNSKVGACLKEVTAWTDTEITGCVEKKDQSIELTVDEIGTTGETTTEGNGTTSATPVTKKDQTISFDEALPITAKVGSQQLIQVTASSGLVVDLVNDTPQVCELFGSAVTFLTAGICTITANQTGNDNYTAAKPVSVNITVVKKEDQTIEFTPPTSGKVGETLILSASGGQSGNPVTFASTTPKICILSSENTLEFAEPGICIVTANQASNENYNAAKEVSTTIVVKKDQILTFNPGLPTAGESAILAATVDSGLTPITFSSSSIEVCEVTGDTIDYKAEGTCTITAKQAGNEQYNSVEQQTNLSVFSKGVFSLNITDKNNDPIFQATEGEVLNISLTFKAPAVDIGKSALFYLNTVAENTSYMLTEQGFVEATEPLRPVNSNPTVLMAESTTSLLYSDVLPAGKYRVYAAYQTTDDGKKQDATSILTVKKQSTISFTNLPTDPKVGEQVELTVKSDGSENAIILSSDTTDICTVQEKTVSFIAEGNCKISAQQNGDDFFANVQATSTVIVQSLGVFSLNVTDKDNKEITQATDNDTLNIVLTFKAPSTDVGKSANLYLKTTSGKNAWMLTPKGFVAATNPLRPVLSKPVSLTKDSITLSLYSGTLSAYKFTVYASYETTDKNKQEATSILDVIPKAYAVAYAQAKADGKSEAYAVAYATAKADKRPDTYAVLYAIKKEAGKTDFYAWIYAVNKAAGKTEVYATALADAKTSGKSWEYSEFYAQAIDLRKSEVYATHYATLKEAKKSEAYATHYATAKGNKKSDGYAVTYATEREAGKTDIYAATYATLVEKKTKDVYARSYASAYDKAKSDGKSDSYASIYAREYAGTSGRSENYATSYATAYVTYYEQAMADGTGWWHATTYASLHAMSVAKD